MEHCRVLHELIYACLWYDFLSVIYVKPLWLVRFRQENWLDDDQGQAKAVAFVGLERAGAEGRAAVEPPQPLGMKKQCKSLNSFSKKQSPDEDASSLTERQKVPEKH